MDTNFSQEQLQALAALGITDDQIADLQHRMDQNDRLRNQPNPSLMDAGRRVVAPNAMSYAARLGNSVFAARDNAKKQAQMDALMKSQTAMRAEIMRRMAGGVPNTGEGQDAGVPYTPPQPQPTSSPPQQMNQQMMQAELLRRMQQGQSYGGGSV